VPCSGDVTFVNYEASGRDEDRLRDADDDTLRSRERSSSSTTPAIPDQSRRIVDLLARQARPRGWPDRLRGSMDKKPLARGVCGGAASRTEYRLFLLSVDVSSMLHPINSNLCTFVDDLALD